MQRKITISLLLALISTVWADVSVDSNVASSNAEPLQAEESSLDVLADKRQEKRYVPYNGVGTGYYGSSLDSYYNPYTSRGLGYDGAYGGYNNLGYGGLGTGYSGYSGYGNAGYGGYSGYGGYGGYGSNGGYGGYGGYSGYQGYPYSNSYYNSRLGYGGIRPGGYGYNSYPSSYYSGGYGSSIVGSTLGGLGGAGGVIPSIPAVGGYQYGLGASGTVY